MPGGPCGKTIPGGGPGGPIGPGGPGNGGAMLFSIPGGGRQPESQQPELQLDGGAQQGSDGPPQHGNVGGIIGGWQQPKDGQQPWQKKLPQQIGLKALYGRTVMCMEHRSQPWPQPQQPNRPASLLWVPTVSAPRLSNPNQTNFLMA